MKRLFRFGPFTLDPLQRVLSREGEVVPLPPKVIDTLLMLLNNPGRVVSKEELVHAVWQETSVGENSLSQNIFLLRKSLREGYIETVPKRGYRFTAPVSDGETIGARIRPVWRWAFSAGIVLAVLAIFSIRARIGSASFVKGGRSSEAYQLYLRGRVQYGDYSSPEALRDSIESFQRAIAKDPDFAPAWAGLADCYTHGVFKGLYVAGFQEAIPKARAAALRAARLDDGLAEAHIALASVKFRYDWDWSGAEKEYKRALRIDPQSAMGHVQYGVYLVAMGRFDEGIAESDRAHQIDPLSLFIQLARGWNYATARRYDEAIAQYQNILRRDPAYARAHQYLSFAYRDQGLHDQEVAEHLTWMAASGQSQSHIASLHDAYRTSGLQGFDAKKAELTGSKPVKRWHLARGDVDGAFAKLEKQFAERNPTLPFIRVSRANDPLRSDPRFNDLLRRMGLN